MPITQDAGPRSHFSGPRDNLAAAPGPDYSEPPAPCPPELSLPFQQIPASQPLVLGAVTVPSAAQRVLH